MILLVPHNVVMDVIKSMLEHSIGHVLCSEVMAKASKCGP